MPQERSCGVCSAPFVVVPASKQRYCSRDCGYRARRRTAEAPHEKVCRGVCGRKLPVAAFYRQYGLPMPYCKDCQRARMAAHREANPETVKLTQLKALLKRKFGMTLEDYDTRVATQRGLCLICSMPPSAGKRLTVDHDHATDAIRGLLCGTCNSGLGMFHDDVERMYAAIAYLEGL